MAASRRLIVIGMVAVAALAAGLFLAFARNESVSALEVPRTEAFPETLLETGIYDSTDLAALIPVEGYHLVELASSLFVDDSDKQRLISVPAGTEITADGDGLPVFPEGTTLVKTFFYPFNASAPGEGRRILETRLLVVTDGEWNVATYIWNDEQTDGVIELAGAATEVAWTDATGDSMSTTYEIPNEHQCVSCHQQGDTVAPLGPKLRNLNIDVVRDGATVNQLEHFESLGLLAAVDAAAIAATPDYLDVDLAADQRARAYLDLNCAHCHQPNGWERPADEGFDLRWEGTATGLPQQQWTRFERQVRQGNMPFFGTTFVDDEGLAILQEMLDQN